MAVGSLLLTALTGKAACSRATGGAARYGPPLAKGAGWGAQTYQPGASPGAQSGGRSCRRGGEGGGGLTGFREGRRKRQGRARGGDGRPEARKGTAASLSPKQAWRASLARGQGGGGGGRAESGLALREAGGSYPLPCPTDASIDNAGPCLRCLRGSPGRLGAPGPARTHPGGGLPDSRKAADAFARVAAFYPSVTAALGTAGWEMGDPHPGLSLLPCPAARIGQWARTPSQHFPPPPIHPPNRAGGRISGLYSRQDPKGALSPVTWLGSRERATPPDQLSAGGTKSHVT